MIFERLTFRSVNVRSVIVPMRRPVVSKVGLFDQWPIILIDIETEEGIIGRSYLEPYLKASARAIISTIHDLAAYPLKVLDRLIAVGEHVHRILHGDRSHALQATADLDP